MYMEVQQEDTEKSQHQRCLHVQGSRKAPGDPDGFSSGLYKSLYKPVMGLRGTTDTYQCKGTSENNQHKMIHVYLNIFNLFMLRDNCLCGSKSGPGLLMNFHSTPPQIKHPSIWHLLCVPEVYYNFNTVNSQTYDSQEHTQAPEGRSHQRIQWK